MLPVNDPPVLKPSGIDSVERRSAINRRSRRRFPFRVGGHRRRRSGGRRKTDAAAYIDLYDKRTWGIALAVLAASFLDAVLTGLQIVTGRVHEANPLMNAAIGRGGILFFFALKMAMTAFPLAVIIVHKEWHVARVAARACLWSYILILLYHLYLVLGFPALDWIFNLLA